MRNSASHAGDDLLGEMFRRLVVGYDVGLEVDASFKLTRLLCSISRVIFL